jgi:hypothetical protein
MDALQVKVVNNKVCIDYTSLFDPEESFYEEFGLNEYKENMNQLKKDHVSSLTNKDGKFKFLYRGKDICMVFSRDGRETQIIERDLADKLFI